jgi:hypothetical protein
MRFDALLEELLCILHTYNCKINKFNLEYHKIRVYIKTPHLSTALCFYKNSIFSLHQEN